MIPTISKLIFYPPFTCLLNNIPKLTINNKILPEISAILISNTHIQKEPFAHVGKGFSNLLE
jgi:hypothetical protein